MKPKFEIIYHDDFLLYRWRNFKKNFVDLNDQNIEIFVVILIKVPKFVSSKILL